MPMLAWPPGALVSGGGGGVYGSDIEFLSSKTMNAGKQRGKYYDIGYRSRNVLPYYLAFRSTGCQPVHVSDEFIHC